ncbi:RNA-directed DNA polymerase, eukaryota [Tanacetum coccineum]
MLWDYLTHVIHSWNGEVVIMGDFNEVRYKSDRFGSVFNVHGANAFNSFIANVGLEEVPLGGSSFTWCHKSATKMSKLDRFLISENLLITCPNITAITLERYLSDHRPILLRESRFDYGPSPFCFYHHWLEVDGFNNFVEDMWSVAPGNNSNPLCSMAMKLKFLKLKIKEWNQRNMKDLKSGKAKLKEDLEALDADIDKGNGTVDMVTKRSEVVNSLQEIDKLQTMEIAQKAKIKWCIEGDENSSFFHGMLNKRRSQLSIRGIMVDGVWIEDPLKVKREFYQHFSNRFAKPVDQRAHINMEYPNTITLEQQIDLECDVTKEELKKAVWDCGIDKSPGPDGFTFGFYRRFWSTIENDVFEAVKYFFNSGAIPNECNSSFIALIPKIPNANLVKDFRPISLIGSMYKIIAKILANRLVGVLGDIVNEVQSAFIAERQILDGPFILNEVLQWCKLKKKQSLIFKVDFEKAFDSIRWDFLNDILKKFGFGDKWCNRIQRCLRSSRGSIIINGSPTEEFYFQKSVWWMRCDDNINILTHMLDCFYWASGLRINMSKSKIMGILVADDKVKSAATKLGCLMLNTPFSYLGTKVGGSMSRTHAWEEVIDKLESIRSHFFNGHDSASRKASWIKWDYVLAPKEKGGLGVSSLYALNRALMFKWVWRFYSQNSSLWARVMKAIHGDDGRIGKDIKACNQSCWLNINDNWIRGNTLKNLYPRIYALENSKQVTVCAKLADIALDASFRRKPRGGIECIQFNEMLVLMQDVSLTPISDRWIWSLEGSGDFYVASTRKAIDDKRLLVVNSKTRWIKYVSIKILSCALFVILAWSLLVISSSRVIWPDSFHVRSLNGGLPLLSKLIPMVNGALGSCRCGSPPNTN